METISRRIFLIPFYVLEASRTSQRAQHLKAQIGNITLLETTLCSNYKAICQLLVIEDIMIFSSVAAEP